MNALRLPILAILPLSASLAVEEAAGQDAVLEAENNYAEQGTFELGGDVAVRWTEDVFELGIGPSFGYFPIDNFEIATLVRLSYLQPAEEEGTTAGSMVIEPSYHLPLTADDEVFLFSGLGFGAGFSDVLDFEIVPRIGLNVPFGRGGVLTPAARVPIVFRPGEEGPSVGFAFETGVGTVF